MSIVDLPVFSMLRSRMHWHQERQRLLAENVANADTPGFISRDLSPPEFGQPTGAAAPVVLARTSAAHIGDLAGAGSSNFPQERRGLYAVRPTGNAVSLEDEMLKVASNAMDYQTAASLYSRSLGLIKLAISRR
jgi:flagellar basal-body rod protein FlgB